MATQPLSLNGNILSISVTVEAGAQPTANFNQPMVLGTSAVIPSYSTVSTPRIRSYTSANSMLPDGFTVNSPEFIAVGIAFQQNPAPPIVWVGRQDLTAIATYSIDAAGTGYAVGDTLTVVQSGASNGVLQVATIGAGGTVLTANFVTQGTGYAVAAGLATTTSGAGTGCTITIGTLGETPLEAAVACRGAQSAWYGFHSIVADAGTDDTDIEALANWATSNWQTTRYYFRTADASVLNGVAGNLGLTLNAASYRSVGIYSTTQSGAAPNNIYAAAGIMGIEAGYATGNAGSYFALMHKAIVGVTPEPLTQTQYTNITNSFVNVYGAFGAYKLVEKGMASDGTQSQVWLFAAMLVSSVTTEIMNVFTTNPVVAQDDDGEQLLLHGANVGAQPVADTGFLVPGTWTGQNVPNIITTGTPIPAGFLNIAQSFSAQTPAARAAGQAMPIFLFATTAGAVQNLAIQMFIQL
jgi:hypothetical protein